MRIDTAIVDLSDPDYEISIVEKSDSSCAEPDRVFLTLFVGYVFQNNISSNLSHLFLVWKRPTSLEVPIFAENTSLHWQLDNGP